MRKLKLYIAANPDGAGKNGEVDWLEQINNPALCLSSLEMASGFPLIIRKKNL